MISVRGVGQAPHRGVVGRWLMSLGWDTWLVGTIGLSLGLGLALDHMQGLLARVRVAQPPATTPVFLGGPFCSAAALCPHGRSHPGAPGFFDLAAGGEGTLT